MRCRIWCLALLATIACTPASTTATRQSNAGETNLQANRRCLKLAWIFRTVVVDNRTILFRMLDGAIWRSRLPQNCTGLALQQGFAYEITIPKICEFDLIRVLGPTGTVCQLGPFEPYAPAEGPGGNPTNAPGPDAPQPPEDEDP